MNGVQQKKKKKVAQLPFGGPVVLCVRVTTILDEHFPPFWLGWAVSPQLLLVLWLGRRGAFFFPFVILFVSGCATRFTTHTHTHTPAGQR